MILKIEKGVNIHTMNVRAFKNQKNYQNNVIKNINFCLDFEL